MTDGINEKARGAISGLPRQLQGPAYLLISSALIGGLIFCDPTAFQAGNADGARIAFFERTLNILAQFWALWALILEPRAVVNFVVVCFFRAVVFVFKPVAATLPGGFDWIGALAIVDARLIRLSEPHEHEWARRSVAWIAARLATGQALAVALPGFVRTVAQRTARGARAALFEGLVFGASLALAVWRALCRFASSFAAKIVASALLCALVAVVFFRSLGLIK